MLVEQSRRGYRALAQSTAVCSAPQRPLKPSISAESHRTPPSDIPSRLLASFAVAPKGRTVFIWENYKPGNVEREKARLIEAGSIGPHDQIIVIGWRKPRDGNKSRPPIGSARGDSLVVSINGTEELPIAVGDAVVRDEVVSTSADSDAGIGLIDSTKLALGPNSTLKIDRAVYSDENRYRQIVINLTAGAFRGGRRRAPSLVAREEPLKR
jgi:hypothetical protein